VVGIERQGYMIPLPPPPTVLYPRDRVLLMGTTEQIAAGKKFLGAVTRAGAAESVFGEIRMEIAEVPAWSRATDRTLGELSPARAHGVQIAGVRRGGARILNPTADERLQAGDEMLVLGTPVQIRDFEAWLRERPEHPAGG
jgi:CPA2 family monovalent cation:H+ antiporter-2